MKYKSKRWILYGLFLLLIICFPVIVSAQIGEYCDYDDPQAYCPIDGGLSALLAVGVGYGIKKIRDARKA